jgi:hypothetical protein
MKNYGERERERERGRERERESGKKGLWYPMRMVNENGEGVMVTAQQKTLVTVFCSNVRDSF